MHLFPNKFQQAKLKRGIPNKIQLFYSKNIHSEQIWNVYE